MVSFDEKDDQMFQITIFSCKLMKKRNNIFEIVLIKNKSIIKFVFIVKTLKLEKLSENYLKIDILQLIPDFK